jgi:hypothetical protein
MNASMNVYPVRNSSRCDSKPSGALAALSRRRNGLNPSGIILKSKPTAQQGGILSNGVKRAEFIVCQRNR